MSAHIEGELFGNRIWLCPHAMVIKFLLSRYMMYDSSEAYTETIVWLTWDWFIENCGAIRVYVCAEHIHIA